MPSFILMNIMLTTILICMVFTFVRALITEPEKFKYLWVRPVLLVLCPVGVIPVAISFIFLWLPRG